MKRIRAMAVVLAGVVLATPCVFAEGQFPEHCDAILVLSNATWWAGKPQEPKNVQLRLQRLNGAWDPVVVGHTIRAQNATHYGFITETASEAGAERLKIRFTVRPDRWIGGEAEAAYTLSLRSSGGDCTGSWTGVVQGIRAGGTVTGSIESVTCTPGFVPPVPGEHPRLLIRKTDIPTLKARAATPEGQTTMAALKADKSIVPQAFVYALTGDPACASNVLAGLDGPCNTQRGWWHHTGGDQHDPAIRIVEHLIAYDLAYDLCTPAMHAGLGQSIRDLCEIYYWGAYNSQFNPNDPSNWSLLYRSALGLMGLSILDVPEQAPSASRRPTAALIRLLPEGDLVAEDLPVSRWSTQRQRLGPWLFAGPVAEKSSDDAFAAHGGWPAQRPRSGQALAGLTWRNVTAEEMRASKLGLNVVGEDLDLARISARQPFTGCYLATVLDLPETGYYRLDSVEMKGARIQAVGIGGQTFVRGDHLHLTAGRYMVTARIWTEPVGNWEPLVFWAGLTPVSEEGALVWSAGPRAALAADAFCGADWRTRLAQETGRNLTAWAYARMAADKAERYLNSSIGDGGWDQEGGYTRHALHLAMPFAHCYRNTFGRDLRRAERMGAFLVLAAARTIFTGSATGPAIISQTYRSGGGPMDLTLFARGYGFVPPAQRPALLWTWNRSDLLAAAGRYKDVHLVSDQYDGLSRAMRFLTRPSQDAEADPATILPRMLVDRQKGGFVLRNRWQDGDDCVVQFFARSDREWGTWASNEGGNFRIDGLGASWAVRGEGYAQGTARERIDPSMYGNLVDVGEHYLGSGQARTIHDAGQADGSAVISLDMDGVYRHVPRTIVPDPKARENRLLKEVLPRFQSEGKEVDLGIRAVRSLAVDYSGACGAPCLVVVADRLTGTKGQNTWTMATPKDHAVELAGDGFLIRAANGATLRGTVVRPAGAMVRLGEHAHVQELNYRGSHAHGRFDTTLIQVPGADRDQDFLVVMTLQRGEAPKVRSNGQGASATVGGRTVGFDGRTILCE